MAQDYPDGYARNMPGQSVNLDPGFSTPWSSAQDVVVLKNANNSFTLSFVDPNYIYYIDIITVTPKVNTAFYITIEANNQLYYAAAGSGNLFIPFRTNPSLNFLDTESVKVTIYNLDGTDRTFSVAINGSKIIRPSGFGHSPFANFTVDKWQTSPGVDITFTDLSTNNPISWDWDFGDGSDHSHVQNPVHAYAADGSYYPTLSVTNIYGSDSYSPPTPIVVTSYEDLTKYTEVDPDAEVTVYGRYLVTTGLWNDTSTYVYKDFGSAHFNGFEVKFRCKSTYTDGTNSRAFFFGIANGVGVLNSCAGIKIVIDLYWTGSVRTLSLKALNGGTQLAAQSYNINLKTDYYIKITHAKDSQTVTAAIYSDPEYSSLITTLTITHASIATTYRYLYAVSSWNNGAATYMYVETGDFIVSTLE